MKTKKIIIEIPENTQYIVGHIVFFDAAIPHSHSAATSFGFERKKINNAIASKEALCLVDLEPYEKFIEREFSNENTSKK